MESQKNTTKKYFLLVIIIKIIALLTKLMALNLSQATSVIIIALFISTTFLFWNMRLSFAFIGVSLLLFFRVLDIPHLIEFSSLDIIIFLIGMMIIVGFLERSHFFEFVIGKLIEKVGNKGRLLIIVLLVISAFSAALIDEVTSILIMTSIVIHLSTKYKVNPIPFVMMTIFATNIGSSATVVGNPVGVMIALKGGLSFADILRWATPISIISLFVCILVIFLIFRKDISQFANNLKSSPIEKEKELIVKGHILVSALLFIGTLTGLILHNQLEHLLGLKKNTLLIGVALVGAGISLLLAKDRAGELVERRVDWWTLVFFMFLFASVGSLEYTGLIDILSSKISLLTGNNLLLTLIVIMLFGGILSAILDNVLAVAIMVPIIEHLVTINPTTALPLWLSTLFSATFFGNLTFIGSTANIVALG
ncbi:MAG: SLC13 family permease, partial [Nanoarchaeota archaeon]